MDLCTVSRRFQPSPVLALIDAPAYFLEQHLGHSPRRICPLKVSRQKQTVRRTSWPQDLQSLGIGLEQSNGNESR